MSLVMTDKQKFQAIKNYLLRRYDDEFQVSFIKLCLEIFFPEAIYSNENTIESAILGLEQNDSGIDAYLVDHESQYIYICQFKTSDNEKKYTIAPKDWEYFLTIDRRLQELSTHNNPRVVEIIDEYRELLHKGYKAYYYFILSNNLTKYPQTPSSPNYYLYSLDDVYDKFSEWQSETTSSDIEECKLEFCKQDIDAGIPLYTFSMSGYGNKKTSVGIIDGFTLIKLYQHYKAMLFNRNVRYFLGNKGINKKIIETAVISPNEFFYYNNGITITCEDFKKESSVALILQQPQIINGAQTVRSIYEAYTTLKRNRSYSEKNLEEHFKKLHIMTRVIQTSKTYKEFATNVTTFNNTQNKILEQDFYANDKTQAEIAIMMLKLGYFYEKKRNEYEEHCKEDAKLKLIDKEHIIKLGDITVIYDAFKNRNNLASSNKKELFSKEYFLEKIFLLNTSEKDVKTIIFSHHLYLIFNDLKKQLQFAEKKKDFMPKNSKACNIRDVISKNYINELMGHTQTLPKENLEQYVNQFDAIKQPYILLSMVSHIIFKHQVDVSKYYNETFFFQYIQTKWLRLIASCVHSLFVENKKPGSNIVNFYKSRDLIPLFDKYLERQYISEDKSVVDLFPLPFGQ